TAGHAEAAARARCSSGAALKASLADALGRRLATCQRIVVDPASVSVVRYGETRPSVRRITANGGDLGGVVPPKPAKKRGRRSAKTSSSASGSDAVIGGSTGRKDRA